MSYGRGPWARIWGRFLANSQQESEALSLEDYRELNSANNCVSLEGEPSLSRVSDEIIALVNVYIGALWDPEQIIP